MEAKPTKTLYSFIVQIKLIQKKKKHFGTNLNFLKRFVQANSFTWTHSFRRSADTVGWCVQTSQTLHKYNNKLPVFHGEGRRC